ncbi:hypothetical protein ACFL6L_01985 [candidate division KSB1 bacterium]
MKLNVKAFAFTCGIIWGMIVFLTTLWFVIRGFEGHPVIFDILYPGYSVSGLGSLLGLVYGFFDGGIIGLLFAWLYNTLAFRTNEKSEQKTK